MNYDPSVAQLVEQRKNVQPVEKLNLGSVQQTTMHLPCNQKRKS